MRDEVQDLFHQTFNILESARRELVEEATLPDVIDHEAEFLAKMSTIIALLGDTYEQLRARVLPIVG